MSKEQAGDSCYVTRVRIRLSASVSSRAELRGFDRETAARIRFASSVSDVVIIATPGKENRASRPSPLAISVR